MKRNSTTVAKPADVTRQWYVVDASKAPLGRVATRIARQLSGKDKVDYTPHVDAGDFVVVINADKAYVTGKKDKQKVYYRYTGYVGNLKEKTFEKALADDPRGVIEHAVNGMLPKNKLRSGRMERLKVYATSEHPHEAQKPQELEIS